MIENLLKSNTRFFDENGNHLPQCGIIALMLACREDYWTMWNWFRDNFQCRKNWKGRMYSNEITETLEFRGQRFGYHGCIENLRVKHVCLLGEDKRFILSVRGHFMYYEKGWLIDQYHVGKWEERPAKALNKFVKEIWELK